MKNSNQSKIARAARIRKVVAGLQKYFLSLTQIPIRGVDYAPTALVNLLLADVAADDLTTSDRAKLTADAEAARIAHQGTDPVLRSVKQWVLGQVGDGPDAASKLADFGYVPRVSRIKTAAEKAAAAAKAKATRVARHTVGPKVKATIHGTVAPSAAGTTEPAAPAATPAPVKPAS